MKDLSSLWSTRSSGLADVFGKQGWEVRLVGGPVRDALFGARPKDEDLCTDATPLEMLQLAERSGLRTIPTLREVEHDPSQWGRGGLKHGTVPFLIEGEILDVTTLRVDTVTDGRHAEVRFVRDFRADAARRDFTFNAMSIDRAGKLHDHFGGEDDLRANVVRFVGEPQSRMQEDFLRILRYYRFLARYGAEQPMGEARRVREANHVAIKGCAGGLQRISGERIWSEMARILSTPSGVSLLHEMRATGATEVIGLPVGNVGIAEAKAAASEGADPTATLGILLADGGLGQVRATDVQGRWKLGNDETARIEFAREHAGMVSAPFDDFLHLALEPKARRDHIASLLRAFGRHQCASRVLGPLPVFPLKGADLIREGWLPGAEVGEALVAMRSAWKESRYTSSASVLLEIFPCRTRGAAP